MTVSFNARGNMIQARLTDGKKVSLRLSTGIKIPDHVRFDKGKFLGSSPEVTAMNNDLARNKVKLVDLYVTHRGNLESIKKHFTPSVLRIEEINQVKESYDIVDLCRLYLSKAKKGEIKSKSNRPLKEGTITTYRTATMALMEYASIAGSLDLMEMSINPKDSVQRKREITDKWNSYFTGWDEWMIDRKYSISTRATYLLDISVMLSYWKERFYFQTPKIKQYHVDPNPIVVLEPEFVQQFLTDEKTYSKLTDTLKYIWEVSAVMLVTTMRVQDAISMSIDDLRITRDGMFLSKMNGKTREYTDVPLPKFLSKVFEDNLAKHGRIYTLKGDYPFVYQNMNYLFALYPEMQHLRTIKTIGVRGEEVVETKPMYEHVHPHMLRKTAITTMIYYKVPERHIKFCSGHSASSTAFERYVAFVERHFKSEVSNYYKQFLGE